MFPAVSCQGTATALLAEEYAVSAVTGNDDADGGDGDAGDQPGQASRGRCGEEEFVVLAAVEGLFEGGTGSDGDGLGVDFG